MLLKFLGRRLAEVMSPGNRAVRKSGKRGSRRTSSRRARFESLENRRVLAHLLNVEIVQVCNNGGTVCAELGDGDTSLALPNDYAYEDEVNAILGQAGIEVNFSYARFNSSATLDISSFNEANTLNSGTGFRDFDGIQMFFVRSLPFLNANNIQPGFSQNAGFTQQGLVNDSLVAPSGRGIIVNGGPARIEVAETLAHEIGHALGLSHVGESTGFPNDPLVRLNANTPNLVWEAGSGPAFDTSLNNAIVANNLLTQAQINAIIANGTDPRYDVLTEVPDLTVSIGPATRNVNESAGTINVTATLSANARSNVTIPLSFSGNAGVNDFEALDNSITIAAGSRTGTAQIAITNDTDIEPNENLIVDFGTPSSVGVTVSNGRQVITIIDNDVPPDPPTIQFTNANLNATEGGGTLSVPIQILNPVNSSISLSYAIQGTADSDEFEILSANPLIIAPNATTANIQIRALSDGFVDPNETIQLALQTPNNAALGNATTATISIVDVPPTPAVISFQDTDVNVSISEVSTNTFTVSLVLDRPATEDISATLTLGGTADENDFDIATTTVTIPQGGQNFTTEITALQDNQNESSETITIGLSAVTGATLGESLSQTVTLLDTSEAENENRILIPESLAAAQQLPGDNQPTAFLFTATSDTTLSVSSVGAGSAAGVQVVNASLAPIGGVTNGSLEAALEAGLSYALIFPASTAERVFEIQSSDGDDALDASVAFNVLKPSDVNGDGNTTVVDAIRVINRVNAGAASGDSSPSGLDYSFEDVNNDGFVTAVDALRIINELNSPAGGEAADTEPLSLTLVAQAAPGSSATVLSRVNSSPIEVIALVPESTSKYVGGVESSTEEQRTVEIESTGSSPENTIDDTLKLTEDWLGLDRQ